MATKKKKKTERKEATKIPPVEQKNVEEEKNDEFNFGGLPQRDLKKNLGCG
jgi:hypothetical protein